MVKVLLFSGGMDSFIASQTYKYDKMLYIMTGSRYELKELMNLERIHHELGYEITLTKMGLLREFEQENGFIPLRNLFFVEVGALHGNVVTLCATKGETSRDKSSTFKTMAEDIVNYLGKDAMLDNRMTLDVDMPFINMTKTEVLRKYLEEGGRADVLQKYTVSCYSDTLRACGECNSCFRRWVAEELNGLNTSMLYAKPPYEYGKALVKAVKGKFLHGVLDKELWRTIPENIDALKSLERYL